MLDTLFWIAVVALLASSAQSGEYGKTGVYTGQIGSGPKYQSYDPKMRDPRLPPKA